MRFQPRPPDGADHKNPMRLLLDRKLTVLAIDPRSQLRKVPRATVPFLPREPLGVTWRDTTVYAVAPESQAARHGIAPGWKAYVRRTRNEERCPLDSNGERRRFVVARACVAFLKRMGRGGRGLNHPLRRRFEARQGFRRSDSIACVTEIRRCAALTALPR